MYRPPTLYRQLTGLVCAVAVLSGCGADSPAPSAAAPALPTGAAPALPAELQQLMNLKDTTEQLMAILEGPCLGEQAPSNGIYHIEIASPQVKTVESYGSSTGTEIPYQENFQRMAEIIQSGNGQFSQLEAQQLCDELNTVIDGVSSMISEASSGPGGPGAPGPPGPGGPKPGGPGPPGPRPPG